MLFSHRCTGTHAPSMPTQASASIAGKRAGTVWCGLLSDPTPGVTRGLATPRNRKAGRRAESRQGRRYVRLSVRGRCDLAITRVAQLQGSGEWLPRPPRLEERNWPGSCFGSPGTQPPTRLAPVGSLTLPLASSATPRPLRPHALPASPSRLLDLLPRPAAAGLCTPVTSSGKPSWALPYLAPSTWLLPVCR